MRTTRKQNGTSLASWQRKVSRILFKHGPFALFTVGMAIALSEPAVAQCIGWMCGPKDALVKNKVVSGATDGSDMIDFIFIVIQILIMLALGALAVALFFKLRREEDFVVPFIALLVALLLVFGSNFIGGYVVGDGSNAGNSTTTGATGVLNRGAAQPIN